MLLKITQAEYLGDYRFQLIFNNGRNGVADLHTLIDPEPDSVFGAFTQESFLRQFELKYGTLCWPGERDVAAEYLYFLAFQDDPTLQSLFQQWGYAEARQNELAA
jgi:hypothetical protein